MVNPSRPSESRMLSATLRTTRSIVDEALAARVPRETIRFWEDRSTWRKSPYPLWRVYAETLPDSAATATLTRSSTYRRISRAELEDAVGLPTARKLGKEWDLLGSAPSGSLTIMAGPPLAGKTTLAREMVRLATETTVLVENDAVRQHVASEMGHEEPRYTRTEHRRTHNVSWELIRMGLFHRCHVIFDATNRTDRGREGAYAAASEHEAPVLVVFVGADEGILRERFEAADDSRKRAYAKLGNLIYDPTGCTVPRIIVESNVPVEDLLPDLAGTLPFALRSS